MAFEPLRETKKTYSSCYLHLGQCACAYKGTTMYFVPGVSMPYESRPGEVIRFATMCRGYAYEVADRHGRTVEREFHRPF